ncbi:MAG: AI-2E family transporter [Bacteroidota bacterium]|nr:AI-2E family transporter [Bacteroidota bacterium]
MNRLTNFLICAIGIVVILIYGQYVLVPFIFALVLWFTVRIFTAITQKIPFYGKMVPNGVKKIISTGIIFLVLFVSSQVVLSSFNNIIKSHHDYDDNIAKIILTLNTTFDIDVESYVEDNMATLDFKAIAGELFNAISTILSSALMILLFVVFIFIEETQFHKKLQKVFTKNEKKYTSLMETLSKIEWSVARYLGIKTLVSLITGFFSYLVFAFCDLNFAVFWAFLIFLLNYIPTIGSLLATIFPAVFSLLQFGDFSIGLIIFFVVGFIQVIIGNFLEPKWLGNSMNISPLLSIISLVFWGAIWGTTGMIISVPVTVVILIILSKFESYQSLAILLSEKGEINGES